MVCPPPPTPPFFLPHRPLARIAAQLAVGNVLPVSQMPEGTIACNLEQRVGDRGVLARSSGDYVTIIGHSEETHKTKIRLPSGMKKTVDSRWAAHIARTQCLLGCTPTPPLTLRAVELVCMTRGGHRLSWCWWLPADLAVVDAGSIVCSSCARVSVGWGVTPCCPRP